MLSKKLTFIIIIIGLLCISGLDAQPNDTLLSYNPKGKEILASAVIPGWGQYLLKNNQKAEIMLWADGVIWLMYAGFNWYGTSRNKDAVSYAKKYADANTDINNRKYYQALERYNNSNIYNEDIRREARERFPDNPSLQQNYYLQNGYFGDSTWTWQNDSLRFIYWEKRKVARAALTRAGFCVGAAILNRVVSSIDCAIFSKDLRNTIGIAPNQTQTGIGLVYRF